MSSPRDCELFALSGSIHFWKSQLLFAGNLIIHLLNFDCNDSNM